MERKTVIVLINSFLNKEIEVWGSLKEACQKHDWKYSTISQKKLPTEYNGWIIQKIPFRNKSKHINIMKTAEHLTYQIDQPKEEINIYISNDKGLIENFKKTANPNDIIGTPQSTKELYEMINAFTDKEFLKSLQGKHYKLNIEIRS